MNKNGNSRELLRKYLDNTISEAEFTDLLRDFDAETNAGKGERNAIKDSIAEVLQQDAADVDPLALSAMIANVNRKLRQRLSLEKGAAKNVSLRKRNWYRYATAAAVLLFTGVLLFFYLRQDRDERILGSSRNTPAIGTGSNKATLSLADGRTYILSESQTEIITGQQGIRYLDGSSVVENLTSTIATLVIPRGGQYQSTLPDGTKVFLNAGSTLRYPTSFDGDHRTVELTGEAFFVVRHDPERPFIVKSDRQEIRVLGTRFNVYHHDGEAVVTTLEEGEVQIRFEGNAQMPTHLRPGQQAILGKGDSAASVSMVNPRDYTSWTQNLFVFNNLPLTAIMKQLERWYDVTVTYPEDFQNEHFFAEIPRDRTLSEVLRQLERSGNFTFEQKERRIIVHQ